MISNNTSNKCKNKWLLAFVIAAFLVLLSICSYIIIIAIDNRLRFEKLLSGELPGGRWYSYPGNISVLIAGFIILLLFALLIYENFRLRQMKTVFEDMAKTDGLTGIFNRRYLEDTLSRMIRSFSRSNSTMSVLMVDVDFFKKYNDTYGHHMGDICLKMIAEILIKSAAREDDFAARYGGEEFVVVLPFTDEKGADIVANRILENVRLRLLPHESSEIAKIVTVSVGGTSSTVKYTDSATDYTRRADQALYMSKHNGRNMYSFIGFS